MNFLKYFIFSISLATIISCSSVSEISLFEKKLYYKSGDEKIQLVPQDIKKTKNIHPVNIPSENIKGALRLILVRDKRQSIPLFDEKKIVKFSIGISDALQDAKPNQDVVFTLEGWYKKKYIKENKVTSARVFYNKSGLNIIFGSILRKGKIHETDALIRAAANEDTNINPYVPGSRINSIKNPFYLSAPPNSGVYRSREGRNRLDWLVFTSRALKPRAFISDRDRQLAQQSNIAVQDFRNELNKLKAELRNVRNNQNFYPNNNLNYPYPRYPNYGYPRQPANPNYNYFPRNAQNQRGNTYIPKNYPSMNSNTSQGLSNSNYNKSEIINELKNLRQRGLISKKDYDQRMKNLINN